jgi:hypothetical protein
MGNCNLSPEHEKKRADILRRARIRELTPLEAEEEAAQAGVGPLAKQASPAEFEPMTQSYWTLAMALAWIIWRTPEKAREYWDDWRSASLAWRVNGLNDGSDDYGYHLTEMEPMHPSQVLDKGFSRVAGPQ